MAASPVPGDKRPRTDTPSAPAPEASSSDAGPRETRKGERFLDPKAVSIYTKDFTIDTVVDKAAPEAVAVPTQVEGDALQAHLAQLGAKWEGHYAQNTGLYPVKNYIAQAFPSVFLAWDAAKQAAAEAAAAADQPAPVCAPRYVLECGCGVGSALLPLARLLPNDVFVGFDVSATAVQKLNEHPITTASNGRIRGYVLDVATQDLPDTELGAADAVLLVFVLSAVARSRMHAALVRLRKALKPDGVLCFRDYGRYDHNERRFFDKGTKVADGGYVKGDGTQQCFFEVDETRVMFRAAGLVEATPLEYHCNRVHNRKTDVEMRKVFVNATFRLARPDELDEASDAPAAAAA